MHAGRSRVIIQRWGGLLVSVAVEKATDDGAFDCVEKAEAWRLLKALENPSTTEVRDNCAGLDSKFPDSCYFRTFGLL